MPCSAKRPITRRSSLRVTAVSACSGVLLLNLLLADHCDPGYRAFSATASDVGFIPASSRSVLRLGARLWRLQTRVVAVNPRLSKEVLAAIAIEYQLCAFLRFPDYGTHLHHRAGAAIFAFARV